MISIRCHGIAKTSKWYCNPSDSKITVKSKLKEDSDSGPMYRSKSTVKRHLRMLLSLEQRANELADIMRSASRTDYLSAYNCLLGIRVLFSNRFLSLFY